MKEMFDDNSFTKSLSREPLPLECYYCKNIFYRAKNIIQRVRKGTCSKYIALKYCNNECKRKAYFKSQAVSCKNCNKSFTKKLKEIKKYPNHFCSSSCSATYNNKNKEYGIKKSKLEKFLEENLKNKYNYLDIKFNSKEDIGSELDIFIPSLKLAFEINGIFHYKPIYGLDKLKRIKINDLEKRNKCSLYSIELIIIKDEEKNFTKLGAKKYLKRIEKIIDKFVG